MGIRYLIEEELLFVVPNPNQVQIFILVFVADRKSSGFNHFKYLLLRRNFLILYFVGHLLGESGRDAEHNQKGKTRFVVVEILKIHLF